jgi:chemotaxis protein CheD
MITRMLNIDEVDVYQEPVELVCFGLGSCIGLFVTDRVNQLSGGAHVSLPTGEISAEMKRADELVHELLNRFQAMGSNLNSLRAKLTGGASVLGQQNTMGTRNADAVIDLLTEKKIYVAAIDVGGHVARTARFNSRTLQLSISTSDNRKYFI